jgi:hypothetical protein
MVTSLQKTLRFGSLLASPLHVMAGLVPAIHVFSLPPRAGKQDVDARDKRGHDDGEADSI